MSGTEQRAGDTKILKRGQAGSRGECLKKAGVGGAGTPLRTIHNFTKYFTGARVNQIVNEYLNGEFLVFAICYFPFREK